MTNTLPGASSIVGTMVMKTYLTLKGPFEDVRSLAFWMGKWRLKQMEELVK